MSIYVFDIDGTISNAGKKVNSTICNKLCQLTENNQVIFASARPVRDMLPMLTDELHSSVFIGCNGGMAWKNGRVILKHVLEYSFVTRFLNILNSLEIPYVLDGEWNYSFSNKDHPFHKYIRSLSNYEVCEDVIISSGVTKILILSENHKEKMLSYTQDYDVSVHMHRNDGFYDITPKGINKHRTLSELIGGEKYIAFGNDQNDFIMLREADVSVFIGGEDGYRGATYYSSMDNIPTLINKIQLKDKTG